MTYMPGYEKTEHALDILVQIHQRAAQLYCRLRHSASQPLAAMFLEQMEKREAHMVETLKEYESVADEKLMNIWMQHPYHRDVEEFLNEMEAQVPLDPSTNEIYQTGNQLDEFIQNLLYHQREVADDDELKLLFDNLLQGEKQESIRLSKDLNSLREM